MVKTNTGRRWHRIAYALASLCFLLGGGIAACRDPVWITDSRFINYEGQLVTAEWHPQKNAILLKYIRNGFVGPAFAVSPDGSQSGAIIRGDNTERSSLSPDWSRLIFSREVKYNEQWNIFASDADVSNQSRLTEGETYDIAPVWSPDGSQIAFYSMRNNDGNIHLYTMSPDGSGQRYIASTGGRDATPPFWSPDSSRIAFIAPRYGELEHLYRDTDLWVAVADGSSLYRVQRMIGFPAWSPDSKRIAYLKHLRASDKVALYTVGLDGSNLTRVYEFGNEFPTWYNIAEAKPSLDWSPDGTKILVSHRNLIATVNTDGSDFQMLMRIRLSQSMQLRATWSPDGSKVIAVANPGTISYPPFPDKVVALFTMDPDGSNRRVIGWWLFGGGNDLRVGPGHNEPWPEHLWGLEARYD